MDESELTTDPAPDTVRTFDDLLEQLRLLRITAGQPSYRQMEQWSKTRPRMRAKIELPRATINDVLQGRRAPSKEFVVAFVELCAVPADGIPAWEAAWTRAQVTRDRTRPAVRTVAEPEEPATPRQLPADKAAPVTEPAPKWIFSRGGDRPLAGPDQTAESVAAPPTVKPTRSLRSSLTLYLSGVDTHVLARCPREASRFVALGGVVLTTGSLAAIACLLALRIAVDLSIGLALVVGLIWGLAILNLDRWMISASPRRDRWHANLVQALPRFVLSMIIGGVMATPLVLWIFDREITAQLAVNHQQKLSSFQERLRTVPQYADVPALEATVAKDREIINGTVTSGQVDADPSVARLQAEYASLDTRYQKAQAEATCQFDGTCGAKTGRTAAYEQKQKIADGVKRERDATRAELDKARSAALARLTAQYATVRESAQRSLDSATADLDRAKAAMKEQEDAYAVAVRNDTGLLSRIDALSTLTGQNPSLRLAYLALLALLTVIDVLPVLVKLLMNLGPRTLYDEILQSQQEADVHIARLDLDLDLDLAKRRAQERSSG